MAMLDNSNNKDFLPNASLGANNPMANLAVGGWDGQTPSLGVVGPDGNYYSLLVANQPYVKRPLIFLMLTYPKGFNYYGEAKKKELISQYKNLLERRASAIEGLKLIPSFNTLFGNNQDIIITIVLHIKTEMDVVHI